MPAPRPRKPGRSAARRWRRASSSSRAEAMLELYHGEPNTFSLKPLIVLHEKGLEYTSHYMAPADFDVVPTPLRATMEVQHNPEGDGPILVHHATAMTESFFISLYLDEAFPQVPLRAADAANRWRVLMWARFVNEVL